VTEAVGEMKGETPDAPPVVNLDLATDAHLPADYVTREESRLRAYRRLADVTTAADVDDIRAEWVDRYGPPPAAAEALLDIARLRADCLRVGISDITVTGDPRSSQQVRMSPVELPLSATMRLQRLSRRAVLKEDLRQLVVPIPRGQPVIEYVMRFIRELYAIDS